MPKNLSLRAMLAVVALIAIPLTAFAAGQGSDLRWKNCNNDDLDPVVRIGNCTLIIEVGREEKDNLASAFYARGLAYRDQKDWDKAIQDYDQAIGLKGRYIQAVTARGNAYREKEDYDRAVRDYTAVKDCTEAVRLERSAVTLFVCGRVYYHHGRGGNTLIDEAKKMDADIEAKVNAIGGFGWP